MRASSFLAKLPQDSLPIDVTLRHHFASFNNLLFDTLRYFLITKKDVRVPQKGAQISTRSRHFIAATFGKHVGRDAAVWLTALEIWTSALTLVNFCTICHAPFSLLFAGESFRVIYTCLQMSRKDCISYINFLIEQTREVFACMQHLQRTTHL